MISIQVNTAIKLIGFKAIITLCQKFVNSIDLPHFATANTFDISMFSNKAAISVKHKTTPIQGLHKT
uniref:Uncharacterized protein n=1 Tax=Romanomermis culicivorax TaxID=13658 RepID=A0A915JL54_ROMCU